MQTSDDGVSPKESTGDEIALTAKLAMWAFERLRFPCDDVENLCDVTLLRAKPFAWRRSLARKTAQPRRLDAVLVRLDPSPFFNKVDEGL